MVVEMEALAGWLAGGMTIPSRWRWRWRWLFGHRRYSALPLHVDLSSTP